MQGEYSGCNFYYSLMIGCDVMPKLELLMPGSIRVGDILAEDIFTSNGVLLMLAGHQVTKENEYRLLTQDVYVCPSLTRNVRDEPIDSTPDPIDGTPEPKLEPESSSQTDLLSQESKEVQANHRHLEKEEEQEKPVHALADSLYRDMLAVFAEVYCHGLSQTHERLIVEKVIYM